MREARRGHPCAWQQDTCLNLQVAVQFCPFTREGGQGKPPQERNTVISKFTRRYGLRATRRRITWKWCYKWISLRSAPEPSHQNLWGWASEICTLNKPQVILLPAEISEPLSRWEQRCQIGLSPQLCDRLPLLLPSLSKPHVPICQMKTINTIHL